MLAHLELTNYKSIANASLDFHSENVIVGPNGVGKSNLLDAIHFLRDAATDGLDHAVTKRHGIQSIRRWSKTRPYNISIKAMFENGAEKGYYRVVIASAGGNFSVIEEEGSWYGEPQFRVEEHTSGPTTYTFSRRSDGKLDLKLAGAPFENLEIIVAESELALSLFGGKTLNVLSLFFSKVYEEIARCGAYSIYPNKIREPQSLSNSDVLEDDGTNLASIIRQMKGQFRGNKDSLVLAMRQVLPILSDIQIKSAGGFFVPIFRVSDSSGSHPHDLNMSQISDGSLRMLGMLAAFYQPKAPRRITLEEPEQMIHPGLLTILVESARDYLDSREPKQLLVTTHSPTLLDRFDPADIISAGYSDGVSSFSSISKRQLDIIKDDLFTAGELLVREGIIA